MSHVLRTLPGRFDLLALAAAEPERYPGLLESARRGGPRARFDILFAFPDAELRLDRDGLRDGGGQRLPGRFHEALDAAWRAVSLPPHARQELPFRGGWLLFLSYELAAEFEPRLRLPLSSAGRPIALALRCPAAIVVDHRKQTTTLVAEREHAHRLDPMERDLRMTATPKLHAPLPHEIEEDAPQRFLDGVERVQAHLRAGDVFQVNLSREWRLHHARTPQPAALHAALRRANPAPFAGLLQQPGWALVSSSPERLIELRGGRIQTRPIAGTRPRLAGERKSARIRELLAHPKERAEHVMLVDLERSDLGRVCKPGSIVVDEWMAVESYAYVHHIVSNISGRLRPDVTPGQTIGAVFPGGSITGCPKLRCMQIISDLEQAPRGVYTGALGYLDRGGDLDLNILIRSLSVEGSLLRLRAGAGIVVDSLPRAELEETRAKARGLLRACGVAA